MRKRRRTGLDEGLQLFICQLIDHHNLCQLLSIFLLVLHEMWDADLLHLSQRCQTIHVFKWHLKAAETQVKPLQTGSTAALIGYMLTFLTKKNNRELSDITSYITCIVSSLLHWVLWSRRAWRVPPWRWLCNLFAFVEVRYAAILSTDASFNVTACHKG